MMRAYGMPFHMTHGPPFCGSAVNVSSSRVSDTITMICGTPTCSHSLSGLGPVANGSVLLTDSSKLNPSTILHFDLAR